MINENELNISNKSYINKDFASIYPELMALAKQLSYKYDPETSNESDPFIVLLKLLAFVGDKLNYNVDKNILERFMPSATQENTMRDLTSMLGYNMNYYIAPETTIYIKYIGSEEFTSTHRTFTFPKLDTVVTTSDGGTQFVLVEDCIIEGYNVTQLKGTKVLQGTKQRLTVLNNDDESEKILLENLDENNRIYFSEKKVAQNGVFISGGTMTGSSTTSGYWERVNSLNTQQSGSYVFAFGYDSNKGYPYVEFPSDISSLIGDGLTIDYIVTDGLSGNISAKKLNTLKSPTELYWDGSEDTISFATDENTSSPLVINNTNGTINGADPEDINSAYANYKKIIGTFDTLVTCRDYVNTIYNMKDSEDLYSIVSNVQVADRRTDLNNATNIVTYSKYGKEYTNVVKTLTKDGETTPKINAYDLVMYPLASIKTYSIDTYKESFTPLGSDYHNYIEKELEDSASISHNYVYPETSDIYTIKNYYKVKAFVSTVNKVTTTEGASILANINKAMIEKFNARNVDFGYEIPYDTLMETIEGADERIKSVSLYEPELETKFLTSEIDAYGNYKEYSLFDTTSTLPRDMFVLTLAKNIMSGRVELFDYYDKFTFEFGQSQTKGYIDKGSGEGDLTSIDVVYNNIEKVTTNANISIPNVTETNGYKLLNNEVVQIVTPSLITKATYPYGINYYLYLKEGNYIPQNTEYELKSGELCVFEYTDSSTSSQVVKIYTHDTSKPIIVKPNFDMYTTSYRKSPREGYSKGETSLSKKIEKQTDRETINSVVSGAVNSGGVLNMFTLTTNDQVEYREVNQVDMSSTSYCAWIINNNKNEIVWDDDGHYMLEEGEYFFQTDLGYNELLSYGSGTVITKKGFSGFDWTNKVIDVTVLDEVGLLGHKEFFKKITITGIDTLNFLEQEIVTLTTNDSIRTSSSTQTSSLPLTNLFETNLNDKGIEYKLSDEDSWTSLTTLSYSSSDYNYHNARAILDINCGPELSQVLLGNQEMTFFMKDGESVKSIRVKRDDENGVTPIIKLERLHQTFGGNKINLTSVDINDSKTLLYDSLCVYQINESYKATNLDNNMEVAYLSLTWSKTNYTNIQETASESPQSGDYYIDLSGDMGVLKKYNGNSWEDELINVYKAKPISASKDAYYYDSSTLSIYQYVEDEGSYKEYSIPKVTDCAVFMVYVDYDNLSTGGVTMTSIDCDIVDIGRNPSSSITTLEKGINNLLIKFSGDNPRVKFSLNSSITTSSTLTIRIPRHLKNNTLVNYKFMLNDDILGISTYCDKTNMSKDDFYTLLLNKIRELDINRNVVGKGFYYCNDVDNSKTIEYNDLSMPYAFYDYNNVANKWTLSEIEYSDSYPNISITRSSLIQ